VGVHIVLGLACTVTGAIAMLSQKRAGRHPRYGITGMGSSYILLLIAFYVDNGRSLPLWKELPPIAYWLLPAAVGIPLIVRALLWHPLVRRPGML
jgi:hypothetical protein